MAQVTALSPLHLLLEVTERRQRRHTAWWTVGIAALGILNLLTCAYLERFVEGAHSGEGYMLFLAAESFFLLLTCAAAANSGLEFVARMTRILPLPAAARFDFVLLALVRHRATMMIAGTALFASALIGPATAIAIAGRIVFMALLLFLLLTCMSTVMILRIRPGAVSRSILASAGLVTAFILIATSVASPGPVLRVLFPLLWASTGVTEVHRGMLVSALPYAGYLACTACACAWIGRRYA